ncbi:AI-2E family transporter [Crenobacter cavernae]|uniref:AI-2E family transporter n=1 Tax=Crenobacter cavernae TaxID=2290923 RepID=A0A345Y3B3_9NEIS|nr:AI-2E family transporter [Crenobacter cavernae]AXK38415.1 AI-2E family transporter [Crenobacter cavernae]
MATDVKTALWVRRALLIFLLGGLLVLSFVILRPFLVPLAWAGILVYVTWPLNEWLRRVLRQRRAWAAFLSTLVLAAALGIPLIGLTVLLRGEVVAAYREVTMLMNVQEAVPESLTRLPWIGAWLQEWLSALLGDREALRAQIAALVKRWGGELASLAGDVGLNAVLLGLALLTAFFFFRDGERLIEQFRQALEGLLGPRAQNYFVAVGNTTRAVVFGLFLAAIAQGSCAGIGYWVAGVDAPVFWGVVTAIIALIPFGAPLIWGSIGIWLLISGETMTGTGLLLWGITVVSWIDNVVRPLVISGATDIPFLLVMFGVLGGLATFGPIGLFIGPVILAVLLAVWREWLGAQHESPPCSPPPAM